MDIKKVEASQSEQVSPERQTLPNGPHSTSSGGHVHPVMSPTDNFMSPCSRLVNVKG